MVPDIKTFTDLGIQMPVGIADEGPLPAIDPRDVAAASVAFQEFGPAKCPLCCEPMYAALGPRGPGFLCGCSNEVQEPRYMREARERATASSRQPSSPICVSESLPHCDEPCLEQSPLPEPSDGQLVLHA